MIISFRIADCEFVRRCFQESSGSAQSVHFEISSTEISLGRYSDSCNKSSPGVDY